MRVNRPLVMLLLAGSALVLGACSGVEWGNLRPARELARQQHPRVGDVHTGWRVYQARCAGCHGEDAAGQANAPDLRQRVLTLGPRSFASRVLTRYEWGGQPVPPASDTAARNTWLDAVEARQTGTVNMPAWQGEPAVTAHVLDVYAYLAGRAEGTLGPGRPPR